MTDAIDVLAKAFVAVCAIFGLYCMIKLAMSRMFSPTELLNAVVISSYDELDMLDVILGDISTSLYRCSSQKIVVFFSEELVGKLYKNQHRALSNEYMEMLDKYNAEWKIYRIS